MCYIIWKLEGIYLNSIDNFIYVFDVVYNSLIIVCGLIKI